MIKITQKTNKDGIYHYKLKDGDQVYSLLKYAKRDEKARAEGKRSDHVNRRMIAMGYDPTHYEVTDHSLVTTHERRVEVIE